MIKEIDAPVPVSGGKHRKITRELIGILNARPELLGLLEKSIDVAARINPDFRTNPVRSLNGYFEFIDRASEALPWDVTGRVISDSLFTQIDQCLNYFYFLHDIPLAELDGRGLYNNSLQYTEPFRRWLIGFTEEWGRFLSSPESWNGEYLRMVRSDACFGLGEGQYESPENWHSFNDFFARRLSSPELRPVCAPGDNSVITAPADSVPLGVWKIDGDSMIVPLPERAVIKSRDFRSVADLIGPQSAYGAEFAGGAMTHMFLDVHNYHRFHFPVGGRILEVTRVRQASASGGRVRWDGGSGLYVLDSGTPDWQMLETRACVIIDTGRYGLAAVMPVGMSQVASVNFEPEVKVGHEAVKGGMMGYFLFGGSNIVLIFQRGAGFTLTAPRASGGGYRPILTGREYGRLNEID